MVLKDDDCKMILNLNHVLLLQNEVVGVPCPVLSLWPLLPLKTPYLP